MPSSNVSPESPNIQTKVRNGTETATLISKNTNTRQPSKSTEPFIIANSWIEEFKLTLHPCLLISLQLVVGWGTIVSCIIMVGQLPNSSLYLSGVGLASTFVNVTGVAITWGFTTALFTLLPQSIGAGQTRLASIYMQRSFYIVTIISMLLSIIQFFAGKLSIFYNHYLYFCFCTLCINAFVNDLF